MCAALSLHSCCAYRRIASGGVAEDEREKAEDEDMKRVASVWKKLIDMQVQHAKRCGVRWPRGGELEGAGGCE